MTRKKVDSDCKMLIVNITKKAIDKALSIKVEPYKYIEVHDTINERFIFYSIVFAKEGKFRVEDLQDMLTKVIEH